MKKIIIFGLMILLLITIVSAYSYVDNGDGRVRVDVGNESYLFHNYTSECFEEQTRNLTTTTVQVCNQTTYDNYIDETMNTYITPEPLENATFGTITAINYVEADDFIVHSEGYRDLSCGQTWDIILNMEKLVSGDIDKSKLDPYYLTEDGTGILFWRFFIDIYRNSMVCVKDKIDNHESRIDILEAENIAIKQELCDFGRTQFC